MPPDPYAMLRSREYVVLLVFAAILGVPIAAGAYGFLVLVADLQTWIFTDLPDGARASTAIRPGGRSCPLVVAGLLVGAIIKYLPGGGGHSPADGFKAGEGAPTPDRAARHLPRRACLARPRRRHRPGGAAHRPRRRAGRAGRAAGQARRPRPGARS